MLVCLKHAANGEEGLTDCCRGADEPHREVAYEESLAMYFLQMRLPIDFVLQSGHASKTYRSLTLAAVLGLSVAATMISPVRS